MLYDFPKGVFDVRNIDKSAQTELTLYLLHLMLVTLDYLKVGKENQNLIQVHNKVRLKGLY